jgi:hypothetical protein
MKLKTEDLINKHKDQPCIVALHGPSLDKDLEKIEELQKNKAYLRISVNEWFNYFKIKPDYWIASSGEFTIQNSMIPSMVWDRHYRWPKNVFNKFNVPLLYNDTADFTSEEFIQQNLKCDYYPFDTRHFKNMKCRDILKSFKDHYEENKNFDFKKFGNNSQIWKPLSMNGATCDPIYAQFATQWSRNNKCCHKIDNKRKTYQEMLQDYTGYHQHLSAGTSVAFIGLAFAVLMGCNPIYVSGLDLDYSKGYATNKDTKQKAIAGRNHVGSWKIVFRELILDDLRILKESAKLKGIEFVNLNDNSWHNVLPTGKLI